MVEAVDHCRLLPISILDIQSVLAPFIEVCKHMSAPLHCYYTAEAGSDFGNSRWQSSGNDAMM